MKVFYLFFLILLFSGCYQHRIDHYDYQYRRGEISEKEYINQKERILQQKQTDQNFWQNVLDPSWNL